MGPHNKVRVVVVSVGILAVAAVAAVRVGADHRRPRAALQDAAGNNVGFVQFTSVRGGVLVSAEVSGLSPGFHGYHVHANNDPANGDGCVPPTFASADGHFAMAGTTHGAHAGDMPVLFAAATGRAFGSFVTDRFTVADVIGRAVIVHAGSNNYGNIPVGPNPDQYTPNSPAATAATAATGNAGARVLCGVIR
jgi:superoxide dismutase, Cu-Zn family